MAVAAARWVQEESVCNQPASVVLSLNLGCGWDPGELQSF